MSGAMLWFAISYAGAVLGYLGVNAIAGRWLGPADFGFFVGALAGAGLLGQVGLVGSHRSGLREVARLRDVDDPATMAVLRNGVRAVLLTTLPLAGIVGGVGAWVIVRHETTATRIALAIAVTLLIILGGQQQLWANYVRGLGHVRFASLLEGRSGGSVVAGLQALCILFAWLTIPAWGLAGALGAVAAGFVIPVLAARHVVRRHWRGLGAPAPRLVHDLRNTLRRDWRFLSAQVAAFLNTSVEIWLAGLLLSAFDTSMFSAGQRLALLLVLPLTALQVVFAPVIARASRTAQRDGSLQRLLRTGASVATGLCLLLAVPLIVAPHLMVRVVYGPGFSEAVPVLLAISIGSFGNVATGMAGTAVSMLGREDVSAQVQWMGAVARVGLGSIAALLWGLTGLTLSALLVSVLVFTVMWWRTRRAVGLDTRLTFRPDLRLLRRTAG